MQKIKPILFFHSNKKTISSKDKYIFVLFFGLLLIGSGLVLSPLSETLLGLKTILTSPSNLVTDYFALGNFGSAFINSGFLTLFSLFICYYNKLALNGPLLAAILTVSGYSLFGKNLFNSIPILLGVMLFAKLSKRPFSQYVVISLFGSALSPVTSYIAFDMNLPFQLAFPLSYLVGIGIGLSLPPVATQALKFHSGFTLYNIGFTSGIIAIFITGILRLFHYDITGFTIETDRYHHQVLLFLLLLFATMFIWGLVLNQFKLTGLRRIFRSSGKLITDFTSLATFGATLINMALMGFLLTGYVLLIDAKFNGAIVGAIFSAVGFSAFGNHLFNSVPVLLGVFLASNFTPLYEVHNTATVVAAIFSTSLAPISGYFGFVFGIIAGVLHIALVQSVGFLHGGLNLYNNGFSSGFVAAFMVPLLDAFKSFKKEVKK